MLGCLCKALLRKESLTHLQNGPEKPENRAFIKQFCTKGMPPKETLGKASPSYSTEKNGQQSRKGLRSIVLGISCFAMKMIPAILLSEL